MKKGGFLRNVLDTIRSNQATGQSGRGPGHNERTLEFGGLLKPSHFSPCQVARHGFPEQPTALAFDPVQKIAAIGTKTGALRVFGRPGVDIWAQHEPAFAVTHIKFVINQGAIITVTADESIHLWSLRGPNLRLQFSAGGGQGGAGCSPQATSPAPTPASKISSSVSPQSGSSMTQASGGGGGGIASSSAASPSSFLGQITDTVTGAVDSASDFLSGGGGTSDQFQTTPSPTSDMRHTVSRRPEIIHTLKFQREHITCLHQTLASKWLYIGTERGNVHVVNAETFELSGYSIAWNKAIELSRKTHPGSIIHISECPQDTNKLLIGYESGCIVIWDLKQKTAEGRYYHTENLLWLAWHYEGKQFVAAHGDGSLVTWQTRSNARPAQILHPHSKMAAPGTLDYSQQQQQSLSTAFARSLNNELYRPINKVEWKITKSGNEPFYLFSGGLPYDGIDQPAQESNINNNRLQASPAAASATSPSISPGSRQSSQQQQALKDKKATTSLRSTSLTVMLGKSITVLEMDDAIIDFITICDNSPYDNDTSDPYAVIVLLSNELILLDLTSSGYPSFDSPYPSASLSESPVTCVQYLADCSSDLIPYLYSTSQNVISRAPKKGFSDKEWPINGGEWGQSMQSYPELVLTGHADGTIKFWDMSGVNFDLISKIKTAKLFEKPNRPANAIFLRAQAAASGGGSDSSKRSPSRLHEQHELTAPDSDQNLIEESLFAIEKIEFEPTTKRLLVASAFGQVIQFRLNKKDHHGQQQHQAAAAAASGTDLTTILVEPSGSDCSSSTSNSSRPTSSGGLSEQRQQQHQQHSSGTNHTWKPHRLFQVRASQCGAGGGSTSGGSSSSSGSHRSRGLSGFQAEIVCLTPLLTSVCATNAAAADDTSRADTQTTGQISTRAIYCRVPPKITVLAFQATHNILAYAHESGIVLVDVIQKCVIINATLNDLYGGSLPNTNDRDISIQPYATSSILQHHYQQANAAGPFADASDPSDFRPAGSNNQSSDNGTGACQHNRADSIDNERPTLDFVMVNKSSAGATDGASQSTDSPTRRAASPATSRPPLVQSRYTQPMFQRQMSTNALTNTNSSAVQSSGQSGKPGGPRLFQRQMTASQLFGGSSGASGQHDNNNNNGKKRLLNAARADANLASSATCLATNQAAAIQAAAAASGSRTRMADSSTAESAGKKPGKNKRIISRMLSISAIHTSVGSGGGGGGGGGSSSQSGQESPSGLGGGFHSLHSHGSGTGAGVGGGSGGNCSSSDTIQANDQTPTAAATFGPGTDKFSESSFRRSRSSSTSSTTGHAHGHSSNQQQQQANESILCMAFVDPALAGPGQSGLGGAGVTCPTGMVASGQTGPGAIINSSSSPSSGEAVGGSAGGQVQSSAGSNHKSLSLNDNYNQQQQQATNGQLALWLGTSSGALLLVALQMPDTEDNRILQLQSITAEPLPHAGIKLNGQILCITPFTCEARLQSSSAAASSNPAAAAASGQQQQTTTAGQTTTTAGNTNSSSSGFQSVGSASSSLEGDTLLQSPGSSGSSAGSAGAVATSGGGNNTRLDSMAGGGSFDTRSSLFLAIASEKQARVYQVPAVSGPPGPAPSSGHAPSSASHHHHHQQQQHQPGAKQQADQHHSQPGGSQPLASLLTNKRNLVADCELSESSYACRSQVVHMRSPDECCLVSYLATGNLLVHALPRLRPVLLDADFVPYSSARISSSMCLSRQGHCLYQPSAGEICKFTVSAHYTALVNDMLGLLYVPREMPEMPRTNFFKSLFSVSPAARQSDRDELFGEAGRPSRGVAHHSGAQAGGPSSSGLDKLKQAAVGTMGHDMRVAREGLDERGEKLSEIEDRTLQMMNQSETYAQAAHQLAQKFKDKKWYQF